MDKNWNSQNELDHFRTIWEYRSPGHNAMHTQQKWDERADKWENELTYDEIKIDSRIILAGYCKASSCASHRNQRTQAR